MEVPARPGLPHGLAGLCGSSPDVGIVGFTLGGGLPILGRAYGFAADRVRSIEVVTPDGQLRTVDAEHEAELFEVLRGGKGNFGVVTAMEFELVELTTSTAAASCTRARRGDRADGVPQLDRDCRTTRARRFPCYGCRRTIRARAAARAIRRARALRPCRHRGGGRPAAGAMRAVSTVIMDTAAPMSYEHIELVNMDPPEPLPYQEGGALLADSGGGAGRVLLRSDLVPRLRC